jgi:hypothetical protein
MANCFWKRGDWPGVRFFTCPERLVEAGLLATISHNGLRLYLSLLHLAQSCSAVVVTLSPELVNLVGLPPVTIAAASKELAKAGLVLYCADHSYHLLDPENGRPMPPHEGRSARGEKRGNFTSLARARTRAAEARHRRALTADQIVEQEGGNHADSAS